MRGAMKTGASVISLHDASRSSTLTFFIWATLVGQWALAVFYTLTVEACAPITPHDVRSMAVTLVYSPLMALVAWSACIVVRSRVMHTRRRWTLALCAASAAMSIVAHGLSMFAHYGIWDKQLPAGISLYEVWKAVPRGLRALAWMGFGIFTFAASLLASRAKHMRGGQTCLQCRYDMRGLAATICPECGGQMER